MDKDGEIPYYVQIKADLINKIKTGEIGIGDQIPPELELAKLYGVSRPTIRQAVLTLVQDGILNRHRGKGTYVASPVITKNARIFSTFAEDMVSAGVTQQSITVKKKEILATASIAKDLLISVGDPVYEIVRLRLGNNEGLVLRNSYISKNLMPNLLDQDLDLEPLYQIIHRISGLTPTGALQSFRAVNANKSEANLLEVRVGAPLMLWEGVIYGDNGVPIEKIKALYRGDRFKFFISQGRQEVGLRSGYNDKVGILSEIF